MAITGEKYRINTLAKDFGLKNKDITEILSKIGVTPKSAMSALEDDQLSFVFEHITQANQTNVKEFLSAAEKAENIPEETKETKNTSAPAAKQGEQNKRIRPNSLIKWSVCGSMVSAPRK